MNLANLTSRKAEAKTKATKAIDKAVAENRDMSPDEQRAYDEGRSEM